MFQQQLKFQDLLPYIEPAKKLDLPSDTCNCVKEELFTVSAENASKIICAWLLWSLDLSFVSERFIGPENKNQ